MTLKLHAGLQTRTGTVVSSSLCVCIVNASDAVQCCIILGTLNTCPSFGLLILYSIWKKESFPHIWPTHDLEDHGVIAYRRTYCFWKQYEIRISSILRFLRRFWHFKLDFRVNKYSYIPFIENNFFEGLTVFRLVPVGWNLLR